MNRHVPHSHIAGDPKRSKRCVNHSICGNHIELQPLHKPEAAGQPHVRYFNDQMQEICHACVAMVFGVEHVVPEAHNHPAVT